MMMSLEHGAQYLVLLERLRHDMARPHNPCRTHSRACDIQLLYLTHARTHTHTHTRTQAHTQTHTHTHTIPTSQYPAAPRRVSYIIYLTDPDEPWREEDGGALELYPCVDGGRADGVYAILWFREGPVAADSASSRQWRLGH
jgi:hypothetical protein